LAKAKTGIAWLKYRLPLRRSTRKEVDCSEGRFQDYALCSPCAIDEPCKSSLRMPSTGFEMIAESCATDVGIWRPVVRHIFARVELKRLPHRIKIQPSIDRSGTHTAVVQNLPDE
jgi:hypothetical protein